MKLATLRNGSRDGQLVVVSRDLTRVLPVQKIAATLQQALDNWVRCVLNSVASPRKVRIVWLQSLASGHS
jgi:hypothetical protein